MLKASLLAVPCCALLHQSTMHLLLQAMTTRGELLYSCVDVSQSHLLSRHLPCCVGCASRAKLPADTSVPCLALIRDQGTCALTQPFSSFFCVLQIQQGWCLQVPDCGQHLCPEALNSPMSALQVRPTAFGMMQQVAETP